MRVKDLIEKLQQMDPESVVNNLMSVEEKITIYDGPCYEIIGEYPHDSKFIIHDDNKKVELRFYDEYDFLFDKLSKTDDISEITKWFQINTIDRPYYT